MASKRKRITIFMLPKMASYDINSDLQWFGLSLGLFSQRDKNKSCFRIFIELLKAAKQQKPLSSDELAAQLKLTRGTVVHHVNRLIAAGIVMPKGRKYMLRVDNLTDLVKEVRSDVSGVFDNLDGVARDLDRSLGL